MAVSGLVSRVLWPDRNATWPTIIYLCTTIARRLIATYPDVGETDRLACPTQAPGNSTLFGLAPDGVYQADRVTPIAGVLLPHRFTLTTHPKTIRRGECLGPFGGLFSVALSLTSRPVDVIDHPILWSPDFPPVVPWTTSDRPTHSQPAFQNDRLSEFRQGSPLAQLSEHRKIGAATLVVPSRWQTEKAEPPHNGRIPSQRRLVQSGSIWIMSD